MFDFNDFNLNDNFEKDDFKNKIKVYFIYLQTEEEIKKYLFDENITIE